MMDRAFEQNSGAWDELVRQGSGFARPASEADFRNPAKIINPFGWLGNELSGQRVLCLAAGGGKHGPLFAKAGASVTVVDLSREMLELDREIARQHGLNLRTVRTSMTDLSMLGAASFDVVLQPVSTSYIEELTVMFQEVARVTKPFGIYVSQHKQPVSLQADPAPTAGRFGIIEPYFRKGPLPSVTGFEHREPGTIEYLHRLDELVGGICRNGFAIEDFVEPLHADVNAPPGSFRHRCHWIPPYIAVKARRTESKAEHNRVWTPA